MTFVRSCIGKLHGFISIFIENEMIINERIFFYSG